MNRIEKIRKSESISHSIIYTKNELYEKGSWLKEPLKEIVELVPLFKNYKELNVLDLGSGVGRNCILIAQKYNNINCNIDCVDILDIAIDKLIDNSKKYGVDDSIKGILSSIEDYNIIPNFYDLIIAVSSLEHISNREIFLNKVNEIKEGIKNNGIVCITINSNIKEYSILTGDSLDVLFELNLETEDLIKILRSTFYDWQKLKLNIINQQYIIPREDEKRKIDSNVVTFVAQKVLKK